MKEYIAETGGRYTYSDDLLNLQELSLSLTAIFSECSAFIISGCRVEGEILTPGYVWLGDKVRYFEGSNRPVFPFYVYEKNSHEPVVYANEASKRGRCCYQCGGGNTVPQIVDPVTGQLPLFLEINKEYAPRLIDKFFGRYALLLDSPSQRQKVQKEVTFTGEVLVEKGIKSAKEVTVQAADGHRLCSKVKADGGGSLGAYLNELLLAEIVLNADGSFSFLKGAKVLAKIDEKGVACDAVTLKRALVGSVYIHQNHLINMNDDTDEGSININHCGFDQNVSRFRAFQVYDGKRCAVPLFRVDGKTKTTAVNGRFEVVGNGTGYVLRNASHGKSDPALTGCFEWQDNDGTAIAFVGYNSTSTNDFAVCNLYGNLVFSPKGYIDLSGEVKIKGTDIYSVFVTLTNFKIELAKKVSAVNGKQLSTEDFTAAMRSKLDGINLGNFAYIDREGVSHAQVEGCVLTSQVVTELAKKANWLMDRYVPAEKETIADNLDLYTKKVSDGRFSKVENLFQDYFSYLVMSGRSPAQAQQILRDQLGVFSKIEVTDGYLRRNGGLSDLSLPNTAAKRSACRMLGAAYVDDCQLKTPDSGWLQMGNSGSTTDTRQLFIRQIGNIVSIQGIINTSKRNGSNMGGIIAVIPNQIQPPKYAVRTTLCDWDNDAKFNRGSSFIIRAGYRSVQIYESGWSNTNTEINFTYFV